MCLYICVARSEKRTGVDGVVGGGALVGKRRRHEAEQCGDEEDCSSFGHGRRQQADGLKGLKKL